MDYCIITYINLNYKIQKIIEKRKLKKKKLGL